MLSVEHINVVALRGVSIEPYCLIVEFCDLGSLYNLIHDEKFVLLLKNNVKRTTIFESFHFIGKFLIGMYV